MAPLRNATVHETFHRGMRSNIIGILPLQGARMIGKSKALLVYCLYLRIYMRMVFLTVMIRSFGLLILVGSFRLRVFVRGCLGLIILSFRLRQFRTQRLQKHVFLSCSIQGQGLHGDYV